MVSCAFRYKEEESHTASRSGHSAVLLRSDTKHTEKVGYSLYVFGGRESSTVDVVGHWSRDKVQVSIRVWLPAALLEH